MMRKVFWALLLLGALAMAQRAPFKISAADLITQAAKYDGQLVQYQGEAIGDKMPRGDFVWLNVKDDTHALGIYLSRAQAEKIQRLGNYQHTGDILRVIGVFHRACPEHGGDLDIHAEQVELIAAGQPLVYPLPKAKLLAAILGLILTVILYSLYRRLK